MSGMAQEVFDLTNEQREIREVCRDFAAREIRPIALEVDEADTEMPWEVWYKAAGLGLTSFMLPSEYGAGVGIRCRFDSDGGRAEGRGLRPAGPEDVDLQRRPRRVLRRLRDDRAGDGRARSDGVRRRARRRRGHLRSADEEDGPARDPKRRDVPRGRRASRGPAAGRGRRGLLRPHADVRPLP